MMEESRYMNDMPVKVRVFGYGGDRNRMTKPYFERKVKKRKQMLAKREGNTYNKYPWLCGEKFFQKRGNFFSSAASNHLDAAIRSQKI